MNWPFYKYVIEVVDLPEHKEVTLETPAEHGHDTMIICVHLEAKIEFGDKFTKLENGEWFVERGDNSTTPLIDNEDMKIESCEGFFVEEIL